MFLCVCVCIFFVSVSKGACQIVGFRKDENKITQLNANDSMRRRCINGVHVFIKKKRKKKKRRKKLTAVLGKLNCEIVWYALFRSHTESDPIPFSVLQEKKNDGR